MGYLANFMVYTFAMVGVIVIALLVFKNATSQGAGAKSKYLKVIDSMSLAPRKTLYIVSTGLEKFLIAGDVDKTTLISKLETSVSNDVEEPSSKETFQQTMQNLAKPSYMDKTGIGIKTSMLHQKNDKSVMRNLMEKINTGL